LIVRFHEPRIAMKCVLVLGREHLAGVEAHADRRYVRTQLQHRLRELLAKSRFFPKSGSSVSPWWQNG